MSDTKFKPGTSGNVNGRPKGSLNRSTSLLKFLGDDLENLVSVCKEKALGGDMAAMKLLIERIFPVCKTVSSAIEIKNMSSTVELTEKAMIILGAMMGGEVSSETGCQLIAAIETTAKVREQDELALRVSQLEESLDA